MNKSTNKEWWRGAVMYQIYPRSYKDLSGDGIGDLKGVTEKLDYVASLGVAGIWISPFFKSPMKDFGYDISDYRAIDPMFGTLEDFDAMLQAAHDRNLKIIIDQVYSHTSDQHPWFQESRKSRDNPKADWYVWADPNPSNPDNLPNNWVSVFGGPAWHYKPARDQFYLHNFLKEQPDLNFHNPEIQDMILDTAEFWFKRGVDGFRLDAINFSFHDPQLRDNPPRKNRSRSATQYDTADDPYNMQEHKYDKSQPEMLDFIRRLRTLSDKYPETMLLGEIGDDDPARLSAEYTDGPERLHTAYNFDLMAGLKRDLTASYIKSALQEQLAQPGHGWPSWAFSNHDIIRPVTRFGKNDGRGNPALARLLIALLCSLRGTIFLYQGDELGLPEARIPEDIPVEKMQDPWGIALYPRAPGRDGCRTPMPWDGALDYAGFSKAEPWLPIPQGHMPLSVNEQENSPHSPLHFTRTFLKWRQTQPALITGDIEFLDMDDDFVLGFMRRDEDDKVLCLFNLSPDKKEVTLPGLQDSLFEFPEMSGAYDASNRVVSLPPFGFFFAEK